MKVGKVWILDTLPYKAGYIAATSACNRAYFGGGSEYFTTTGAVAVQRVITYNATGIKDAELTLSSRRFLMAATMASISPNQEFVFFAGGYTNGEGVSNSVDQFNCNGYDMLFY